MRFSLLSLALIGAVILLCLEAAGHVPLLLSSSGNAVPTGWPPGVTVGYRRHSGINPGLPNLAPGSVPSTAIDAGMSAAGAAAGTGFTHLGVTPTSGPLLDGTNIVSLANTVPNQALLMGGNLVTLVWYDTNTNQVTEFDVIGTGQNPLSTTGTPGFFDLQSLMTHAAGHVLGLDHSADFAATMFPTFFTGSLARRSFTADERRALQARQGTVDPSAGTIAGTLQRPGGAAVIAGHAVLSDAITGQVAGEAVSDAQGAFAFDPVLPGVYHLYFQPLDGPTTPGALIAPYWTALPFDTAFRTRTLGSWNDPDEIVVHPGENLNLGVVVVDGPPANLNPDQVFFNTTPTPTTPGTQSFLETVAPFTGFVGIFGAGVDLLPDAGFDVAGPFATLSGPSTWTGPPGPVSDRIFPLSVPAESPPGAFLLRLRDPASGEAAVFPGCLEVLPASPPRAWTAEYGRPGLGSTIFNRLTANGVPALGNAAFSLQVTGAVPGQLAYWLFSAGPEAVVIVPSQELSVDPARLLIPATGAALSIASPTVTLPLPIPSLPALGGVRLYVQVLLVDPLAPLGATLSNGLALGLE